MTTQEAMAEVFLKAFLSMPHKGQDYFFCKIVKNKNFREDLIDLAIAEERNKERTKPFKKAVENIRKIRKK